MHTEIEVFLKRLVYGVTGRQDSASENEFEGMTSR